MKKLMKLFGISTVFVSIIVACSKDAPVEMNNELEPSVAFQDWLAEYKKEIAVSDESGKNTAFFAVYSDDVNFLNDFLLKYDFSITVFKEDIENLKSLDQMGGILDYEVDKDSFNMAEPKIFIDYITSNLEDDIKSYKLNFQTNRHKSGQDFVMGYPVFYSTWDKRVGVVHAGWGREFLVQYTYRTCRWPWCGAQSYTGSGGVNAWWIWPSGPYYNALYMNTYQINMIIRPHYYQNSINYEVHYSHNARTRDCLMGSYDGINCHIAAAPAGTNAFIYTTGSGTYFYYTPVNGNQCPLSGSSFDGVNCRYLQIPSWVEPFIYNNRFYVRPEKLFLQ